MKRSNVAWLGLLLVAMPAIAAQIAVSMIDFAFSPSSVSVNPGDEVVWTNNGYYPHTSTSGTNGVPDGIWNSGDVSPGNTYTRMFSTSGTFPYFCMHHWGSGMTGEVIVGTSGVGDSKSSSGLRPGIRGFPNPFRSATTLEFGPPNPSPRTLRIYDASGHLVGTLAAAPGMSGSYRATWDGRGYGGRELPAGIYHCVTNAGSIALVKLD